MSRRATKLCGQLWRRALVGPETGRTADLRVFRGMRISSSRFVSNAAEIFRSERIVGLRRPASKPLR